MSPPQSVYGFPGYPPYRTPNQFSSAPPAQPIPTTFPMAAGPSSPYLRHASPMPPFVPQGFAMHTSPQMPEGNPPAPEQYGSLFAPYDQQPAYTGYPFGVPLSPVPQPQYAHSPYGRDHMHTSPMVPPATTQGEQPLDYSSTYLQGAGIQQGEFVVTLSHEEIST
jgi:hypothetical protein